METLPDAKMVDIKIVEVPFCWSGFAPDGEIGARENRSEIKLVHIPSGIQYVVQAPESVSNSREAAELRAKAKIRFVHELHGESWLND